MAAPMPAEDEFGPGETLIHVPTSAVPDSLNRVLFTAFWLDEYRGVRGQVFHCDLSGFERRHEERGQTVRRWTSAVDRDPS